MTSTTDLAGTSQQTEAQSFRARHEANHLYSIWDRQEELRQPQQRCIPFVWRWEDIFPLLTEATSIVNLHQTDRRAFILANPGLAPHHATTATLYASYQIVLPGETAEVHRHTPSASRFILQSTGGYTTVEGEKCTMQRGDLIVTPNGTWHDHGNDGEGPAIWVDVLDLPLVEYLGATKFDLQYFETSAETGTPERRSAQSVTEPAHSENAYGFAGMLPTFLSHSRGENPLATPKFVYRWSDVETMLSRLSDYHGSPYDGVKVEYRNPVTGGPLTPAMDFSMQMLRAGERTKSHRHTSSTVYTCLEGSGQTIVGETTIEWRENDSFAIPPWAWHQHTNPRSDDRALLYSVSDAPLAQKLGLYREEAA